MWSCHWSLQCSVHDNVLSSVQRSGQFITMSGLLYRGQDFEKAGSLRDKEMELKAQISKITNQAKESEQAEVESGDNTGPMVTEADIANIVAQWTGTHCNTSAFLFVSLEWQCLLCIIAAEEASSAIFCYAVTAVVQKDKQGSNLFCIMPCCNMQRTLCAQQNCEFD